MDFSAYEIIALYSIASLFVGIFIGHAIRCGEGQ